MGTLKQLRGTLAVLKPRVAWLNQDRAAASRARDRVVTWRWKYKTKAWRQLRWRVLLRDLFTCQMCKRTEADTSQLVGDHKVAHKGDDALFFDEANVWCLCKACHDSVKQREEKGGFKRFGFSIPFGIKPSAVPVTLVCGPPASGKSSYVARHARQGDLVIDFDVYRKQVGGRKWDNDPAIRAKAFALRDADINSLASRQSGAAWLIVMAPTTAERAMWADALGSRLQVHLLAVDAVTCKLRVRSDPTRQQVVTAMDDAIDRWWQSYDG